MQQRNNGKTTRQQLNKIHDSSEEDNELGDETISGENDVEYAEFSLSVRTSPKEQVQNHNGGACTRSNGNGGSGLESASLTGMPTLAANCAVNINEFDDFMSLPISTPANVSSNSHPLMPVDFPHSSFLVLIFNFDIFVLSLRQSQQISYADYIGQRIRYTTGGAKNELLSAWQWQFEFQ